MSYKGELQTLTKLSMRHQVVQKFQFALFSHNSLVGACCFLLLGVGDFGTNFKLHVLL